MIEEGPLMQKPSAKITVYAAFSVIAILAAMQFIPYGKNRSNPPVAREPVWSSPEIRSLAKRACFDCHSNETVWPWYSRIAPVSWLVLKDVNDGRTVLNFSEWEGGARKGEHPEKIREELIEGEMPPIQYRLVHAGASLTEGERRQLADGLAGAAMADMRHILTEK